jgi:hypothetical protein
VIIVIGKREDAQDRPQERVHEAEDERHQQELPPRALGPNAKSRFGTSMTAT